MDQYTSFVFAQKVKGVSVAVQTQEQPDGYLHWEVEKREASLIQVSSGNKKSSWSITNVCSVDPKTYFELPHRPYRRIKPKTSAKIKECHRQEKMRPAIVGPPNPNIEVERILPARVPYAPTARGMKYTPLPFYRTPALVSKTYKFIESSPANPPSTLVSTPRPVEKVTVAPRPPSKTETSAPSAAILSQEDLKKRKERLREIFTKPVVATQNSNRKLKISSVEVLKRKMPYVIPTRKPTKPERPPTSYKSTIEEDITLTEKVIKYAESKTGSTTESVAEDDELNKNFENFEFE